MGIFSDRPGYAQSFPIPFGAQVMEVLGALPSFIVLERQKQIVMTDTWYTASRIALPMHPREHATELLPSMAIQRAYKSDAQFSSGIRSGSITIRGTAGLTTKLGYNADGAVVYAQGQALSAALRAWLVNFVNAAKDPFGTSVRLVLRNLDMNDAYVVKPQRLAWRRSASGSNRIMYEYDLAFEVVRVVEPNPLIPAWMQFVDGLFDTYQAGALVGLGTVELIAVSAKRVDAIIGAAIDAMAQLLRDLVISKRNIVDVSIETAMGAVEAMDRLQNLQWVTLAILHGELADPTIDPLEDPDRIKIDVAWVESQLDLFDGVMYTTDTMGAMFSAQQGRVETPKQVLPSDDIHTLPPRMNRTPEQLVHDIGVGSSPLVDAEAIIPGSLQPGTSLSVNSLVPTEDAAPAGIQAENSGPAALYGTNYALAPPAGLGEGWSTPSRPRWPRDMLIEDGGAPEDVQAVVGQPNLDQGLRVTLRTIRRSNLTFPFFGVDAPIGEVNTVAPLTAARAIEALLLDDRVQNVTMDHDDVSGDRVIMHLRVHPWGDADKIMEAVQ